MRKYNRRKEKEGINDMLLELSAQSTNSGEFLCFFSAVMS
jgi:hypothetical protein